MELILLRQFSYKQLQEITALFFSELWLVKLISKQFQNLVNTVIFKK